MIAILDSQELKYELQTHIESGICLSVGLPWTQRWQIADVYAHNRDTATAAMIDSASCSELEIITQASLVKLA